MDPHNPEVAVFMKDITKVYPDGVVALRNVNFWSLKGKIHALLGENGAGKTTLMRILYGEIKPTRGEIWVWGKKVNFSNPREALAHGIAMVYQNFTLIPNFTVFENIYLALSSVTKTSRADARKRVESITRELGYNMPLDMLVEELPVGQQQKVEILKALIAGARLLILDEPTSVLTPLEARALRDFLEVLKTKGVTVILITHRLREVKAAADMVTVLRKGELVGVFDVHKIEEVELAKLIIGRTVEPVTRRELPNSGDKALIVEDLYVRDDRGILKVKGISFDVRYGENVGIAGVQGNGQKELLEAIVGIRAVEKGKIYVNGVDVTDIDARARRKLGIAYIPDSKSEGLALSMTIVENSIVNTLERFLGKLQLVKWPLAQSFTLKVLEEYNVVYKDQREPVKNLSGGNQQRLMVGREISLDPRIILAHEPSQGLDVASSNFIRSKLLEFRDKSSAILLVSSDLDELLGLSDRILVIFDGKIVGGGKPEDLSEEKLGALMGGLIEA